MRYYKLPHTDSIAETVILANGDYPTQLLSISILENCRYLVCCDGAANQLIQHTQRLPGAIVGDCDSLSEEVKKRFAKIIFRNTDQETNDLTKAVNFCVAHEKKQITILGATGKREDHTIANISLLTEYIEINELEIEIITDYGIFNGISSDSRFESFVGQQVSVFNLNNSIINSSGLKYPIQERLFTNWWQGTLNESNSDNFEIKTSDKTIIFRAFSL